MKYAEDIKINDILWVIDNSDLPQITPLVVTNIKVRKLLWTGYYDLTLLFPNGNKQMMSLFDTGKRRDYDIPWLADIGELNLDYDVILDLHKTNTIMSCFDKKALYTKYITGLKNSIKTIEEVIQRGRDNLFELTSKLNYFNKQIDIIKD